LKGEKEKENVGDTNTCVIVIACLQILVEDA
jgi:hypothetical protein